MPVTSNTKLELAAPTYTFNEDTLEKGPIPPTETSGNRFLIIDLRDTVRGRNIVNTSKGQIISINKVLQEINPEAEPAFGFFLQELFRNYPGYKMKLNAIGRSFRKSEELQLENPRNAPPGFSKHNYYAAMDFNIVDPNGVTYMKDGNRLEWIK